MKIWQNIRHRCIEVTNDLVLVPLFSVKQESQTNACSRFFNNKWFKMRIYIFGAGIQEYFFNITFQITGRNEKKKHISGIASDCDCVKKWMLLKNKRGWSIQNMLHIYIHMKYYIRSDTNATMFEYMYIKECGTCFDAREQQRADRRLNKTSKWRTPYSRQ